MSYLLLNEKEDGWSDYVAPPENHLRVECCGCGLVHDVEIAPERNASKPRVVVRFKRNLLATRRRRAKR